MTTLRFILLAFLLVLLFACTSSPTPSPTVDVGAIQTKAASDIFATQTASVPTAPIPKESPVPTFTSVPNSPTLTREPTQSPSPSPSNRVASQVVKVVDGDTIDVSINGKTYRVRYIGIDSPETVNPDTPIEWMGPEASAANKRLVEGKTVYLEKDVSETDKYGRLLRYVYVGDLFVNAELVRLGYAQVATYPPDVKYQELFLELEGEARVAGAGLWGATPTKAVNLPTATRVRTASPRPISATPTINQRANCDPSYPDVCIPPPPPDLDCKEIPYRRFRVLLPDPHRFDADHDGVGCES